MRDSPAKTLHCLGMMRAAQVLAECAPTDHRRRVVARYAYVFCEPLLVFGLNWRKELARSGANQLDTRNAKDKLRDVMSVRNDQFPVRDFLGAKRLSTSADRASDARATVGLWTTMNREALDTLVRAATSAAEALCAASGQSLEPEPNVDTAAISSGFAGIEPAGASRYLVMNTGSYGPATDGALTATGGEEVGRRIAQINDVADQLQTVCALWPHLRGRGALSRLLRAASFAEMSSLLDLTIGPPPGAPRDFESLLDLLADDAASPGRNVLAALAGDLDTRLRNDVRICRNAFGAHVDRELSFPDLGQWIDAVDVEGLSRAAEQIIDEYLDVAGASDPLLGLLVIGGSVSASFPHPGGDPIAPWDGDVAQPTPDPALPQTVDSRYVAWVHGPNGSIAAPAVAGLIAGRARRVSERLQRRQDQHAGEAR